MRICASQRNRRCRKPALRWRKPQSRDAKRQATNPLHGERIAIGLLIGHLVREAIMPAMELTEILAWALIVAGAAYAILESRGASLAAIAAALAALATKTALLDLG